MHIQQLRASLLSGDRLSHGGSDSARVTRDLVAMEPYFDGESESNESVEGHACHDVNPQFSAHVLSKTDARGADGKGAAVEAGSDRVGEAVAVEMGRGLFRSVSEAIPRRIKSDTASEKRGGSANHWVPFYSPRNAELRGAMPFGAFA